MAVRKHVDQGKFPFWLETPNLLGPMRRIKKKERKRRR
jgi:hypothetical protein